MRPVRRFPKNPARRALAVHELSQVRFQPAAPAHEVAATETIMIQVNHFTAVRRC
jgi:hypothetical protein